MRETSRGLKFRSGEADMNDAKMEKLTNANHVLSTAIEAYKIDNRELRRQVLVMQEQFMNERKAYLDEQRFRNKFRFATDLTAHTAITAFVFLWWFKEYGL